MANANNTDEYRVAHVMIFVDAETCFDSSVPGRAASHIMTEGMNLSDGQQLPDEQFPLIPRSL